MSKNPYFIRLRVGGDVRLECNAPTTLTELQLGKRKRDLELLRNDLLPLGDHGKVRELLLLVAKAPTTEAAALQSKLALRYLKEKQSLAARTVAVPGVPTFQEFATRWATDELASDPRFAAYKKKLTHAAETRRTNQSLLAPINRVIGHIPLTRLTEADCRRAVAPDALPAKAESSSTVRAYYQVLQTVLRTAMSPCGIITQKQYPLPVLGWLPPIGTPPSYPLIYPRDMARLLGNADLPLWRRVLYGMALSEGPRVSHLLRLKYSNVDFSNEMLTIGVGKNNANARTWAMQAGVAAALLALKKAEGKKATDFIFPQLSRDAKLDMAEVLRDDLVASGVTGDERPDLFASGDGQEPFRFQDLRQSFVAFALAMGFTETQVMARTQHTTSQVMQKHYGRKKELALTILAKQGPFLPLDVALGLAKKRPAEAWSPSGVGNRVGNENLHTEDSSMITSAPGRIRTSDPQIRNPLPRLSEQHEPQKPRGKARVRTRKVSIPHPEGGGWGIGVSPDDVVKH